MKTTAFAVALLGFLPAVLGQELAPSPTESVGCEPHGDHWHCEGPRTDAAVAPTTAAGDDDHDHAAGTGSLAPSPTESVGCEPHGDHWHCEGPRTTAAAVTTPVDDDDDHAAGTGSLAPSPTESVGCEPHGDHWHCEGPRTTAAAPVSTPAHDDHDDHDDHASGTASLAPSPTESVGCEPHGDHWHCEGPRTTAAVVVTTTKKGDAASPTETSVQVTNGAGLEMVPVVGMFAAAMLAL